MPDNLIWYYLAFAVINFVFFMAVMIDWKDRPLWSDEFSYRLSQAVVVALASFVATPILIIAAAIEYYAHRKIYGSKCSCHEDSAFWDIDEQGLPFINYKHNK